MQPPPNFSAVAAALGRRKLGGSASRPDVSRVAAKLPAGLKGFRLATGAPAAMARGVDVAQATGSAGGGFPAMERYSAPPASEATVLDFAAQNPGLTEDFIRSAAGGAPAPPPEVQGRALNPDGTSITGRGGNVQQLGAAALRRLGGGAPTLDGGTDMVAKRLPRGLKGFRLPPGFDPTSIMGQELPGGPREPDAMSSPRLRGIRQGLRGGPPPAEVDPEAGMADQQPPPPPRPRPGGLRGRRMQGY